MKTIDKTGQDKTPYIDCYLKYLSEKNTAFDVPGHHQGKIKTDLDRIFTHRLIEADVNAPRGMDNLSHPTAAIKEAEELWAKATGAKKAIMLVNGSTSGNLLMLMSSLMDKDKIIVPRNIHKSVISGLILSGAIPIFVMPEIDPNTEIAMQPSLDTWKKAIDENPDAKAVFVINPTYFGSCTDLKKIVSYAHKKNMIVLVDEAHGSHFYFSKHLPCSAMEAGADMATLSIHKTGGSLTQSSVLLINTNRVTDYDITKTFNIITTTSPSSVLLASLDAARKFLVFRGSAHLERAKKCAQDAIFRINSEVKGFKAHGKEYFLTHGNAYNFDTTKVVLEVGDITLSGFQVYALLKDTYHIQVELAETYCLLLLFTIGTMPKDVDTLVNALKDISEKYQAHNLVYPVHHLNKEFAPVKMRPRDAYNADLKIVDIKDALNRVSKESIMIYPPGIPVIIPGEVFTEEIIKKLEYYKQINAQIICDYNEAEKVSTVKEKDE